MPPSPNAKIQINLEWQNGKEFIFSCKAPGDTGFIDIVKVEEDGDISIIWNSIASACRKHFTMHLDRIGSEMKLPSS